MNYPILYCSSLILSYPAVDVSIEDLKRDLLFDFRVFGMINLTLVSIEPIERIHIQFQRLLSPILMIKSN